MIYIAWLCLLGAIVCQIIVLIKMFTDAGVVQGIIGLICGIWAYIWGWLNSGRLGIRNIMIIWTILIILYCIFFFLGGGMHMAAGGMPTATP